MNGNPHSLLKNKYIFENSLKLLKGLALSKPVNTAVGNFLRNSQISFCERVVPPAPDL